jgi:hypothetical protein
MSRATVRCNSVTNEPIWKLLLSLYSLLYIASINLSRISSGPFGAQVRPIYVKSVCSLPQKFFRQFR